MALPTVRSLDPDRQDPLKVLLGMCEIVFTRDAGTEKSYSSSYVRARELMSAQLRAELLRPAGEVRPLPHWVEWQRHDAHIRPSCEIANDRHPADTPTQVSRVLAVREAVTDGAGDALPDQGAAVWATTTKVRDQWVVSRFDVTLK